MQKRNTAAGIMICIITMTVTVAGCQNTETAFSFDPEQFSYQGAELTEIQKRNMGKNMAGMVEAIIDAVNKSEKQVDLSAYTQKNQTARDAFQIAAYIDPLAEIAAFEEDNNTQGVFHINYGCSIEEHRSVVTDFNNQIDGIVKSCAGKAKTDIEYAMAVFRYLADHCQYDYNNYANSREAGITSKESALRYGQMSVYHVIMDGSGVCQQFSRAFSLLLQQADIPVFEIAGVSNVPFASNNVIYNGRTEGELFGISHMWNIMQLSGEWYGADVTFAVSAKESSEDAPDALIYQYFGMSDATIQDNFPSDTSMIALYQDIDIPSCGADLNLPEKEQISEKIDTGDIASEDGQIKKIPVDYELIYLNGSGSEEIWMIYFDENDAAYRLTITLPEGYTQEKTYPVCYLLGNDADEESVDPSSVICVKISEAAQGRETDPVILEERDFSRKPALFLNRFLYGIIEATEKEYSVDTSHRTLYGENLGANMSLFILFQNDNLARNVFSHYICVNPDLYYTAAGRSLMLWEAEYFQRCKELPVLLTISENDSADAGKSLRTGLLSDIIKKREYKNLLPDF